jgi:hypothetical protein
MKVKCAWCEREGSTGYLRDREPFDDPRETHGICRRHRERVLHELCSPEFADLDLLIVVDRKEAQLYAYLRRNFAEIRGVRVIMERRVGDRRTTSIGVTTERRARADRRRRTGVRSIAGYRAVRLRSAPTSKDDPA